MSEKNICPNPLCSASRNESDWYCRTCDTFYCPKCFSELKTVEDCIAGCCNRSVCTNCDWPD